MKETFYFSHDYHARQDEKICFYLSKEGMYGYGVYWMLIERMHDTVDGKLTISLLEGIAYSEHIDITMLLQCYNTAITSGLFVQDLENDKFWSNRVLKNKQDLIEFRQKKSDAGRAGMLRRWSKDNSVITKDNTTITNDNKGKESKVNKSKVNKSKEKKTKTVFLPPSQIQVIEYFKENGFPEQVAVKAFNYYQIADWHDGKGEKVRNWKQKMQSVWFKEENRFVNKVQVFESKEITKKYKDA